VQAPTDPAVERLPAATRELLASIWAERATSELGAGSGCAQVVVGLYAIGAVPEVLALATNSAREEVEHAQACHRLAELYAGRPVPMPTPKKVGMPPHVGATDALRATLHAMGLSCFNETIAAEFVAACLDACEAETVREATAIHLRDEIGHARMGWAHLNSGILDRNDRKAIAAWMPRLTRANGRMWLRRLTLLPQDGVSGHGYPPRAVLEDGVRRALREIVVPGLAHVGIDATGAAREAAAL
jgi:hypothetical protein